MYNQNFIDTLDSYIRARSWDLAKDGIHSTINFSAIMQNWQWGKNRYYHNLNHLETMMDLFIAWRRDNDEIHDYLSILLMDAILIHDIIYVPGATDNEEKSAAVIQYTWPDNPVMAEKFTDFVRALVLSTKYHFSENQEFSGCELLKDDNLHDVPALLLDFDVHILSADQDKYLEYARAVYMEYSTIASEEQYISGRLQFLRSALDKTIYHSTWYTDRYPDAEESAKRNINEEIHLLETNPAMITASS